MSDARLAEAVQLIADAYYESVEWTEWNARARAFLAENPPVLREDTTPSVMTNLSEPSEADNKNVISVCRACGSDDPTYFKPKCMTEFGHVPDPFHSQGEPCDLCGDTGWVHEPTAPTNPWACPRGCKPEGETP